MSDRDTRLCVLCDHFRLYMGSQPWSEVTPGEAAAIYCDKGHWDMDNGDGLIAYRANIVRAETCPDYKEAK